MLSFVPAGRQNAVILDDWYEIVGGLTLTIAVAALVLTAICVLEKHMSGWYDIQKAFTAEKPPDVSLLPKEFINARGSRTGGTNGIRVGVSIRGLYFALTFPLSIGTRPVLVPWTLVTIEADTIIIKSSILEDDIVLVCYGETIPLIVKFVKDHDLCVAGA